MDVYPFLIAATLPWSTTAVIVFVVIWFITLIPTMELRAFLRLLKDPIAFSPIALFTLAAIGLLWSEAPWGERVHGLQSVAKLLAIPFLLYHYRCSTKGWWVFAAFLASCLLLQAMSWIVLIYPNMSFTAATFPDHYGVVARGIPVKNYIDQSQEFSLATIALAFPILTLLRARRILIAALLITIALSFVGNMIFVVVSRTTLIAFPIVILVFAYQHLGRRGGAIILCATVSLGALAWITSSQLRWKVTTAFMDYHLYKEKHEPTSVGLRLDFWQKSLASFSEAPILGHGTGSIRGILEKSTPDQLRPSGQIIRNVHNQTLNVAVQWGVVGTIILFAMWCSHLLMFRGLDVVSWIGLSVVVQNICTSVFNSHLSDFVEGWIYVMGVGVAGGMLQGQQARQSNAELQEVKQLPKGEQKKESRGPFRG